MLFRLAKVSLERGFQRTTCRSLSHFGKSLRQSLFRIVKVLDLNDEEVIQRVQSRAREDSHRSPPEGVRRCRTPSANEASPPGTQRAKDSRSGLSANDGPNPRCCFGGARNTRKASRKARYRALVHNRIRG